VLKVNSDAGGEDISMLALPFENGIPRAEFLSELNIMSP
jgi:hypothetical protein